MVELINTAKSVILDLLSTISNWASLIQLTTEQIALFSIFVSILIFSMGKRYELRFKKHELKKDQYAKFIKILEEVFMGMKLDDVDKLDESFEEMKKDFFDMGSSLLLYGSKKLYKQYVFYREFADNSIAKLSKHYNQGLVLYIISDMLKTIRKEVGLNYLNSISDVEILAFFVNDIASNPNSKIDSFRARYQLRMIKLEMFILERLNFVYLKNLYYLIIAPVLGILGLIRKYLILVPLGKLVLLINPNAKQSVEKFEKETEEKL